MYDGYAQTNMRDLLTDLKALTKTHMDGGRSTALKGLKTLKRGVLSNTNTIFPAIAFFPIQEVLYGYRNGGLYRVDRYVNIELYVKQQKVTDSGLYLQELCQDVTDMFDTYYDDWQLENEDEEATVFSFEPSSIQYETTTGNDSVIQGAVMPFTFSSWEQAPTFTVGTTILDGYTSENAKLKSIGEYLYTQMKNDSTLTNVKFHFSHATPPTLVGQGVVTSVIENSVEATRREAGRNNPNGQLDVLVWTKASPFEGTLDLNLETVEKLKDVIQAIPTMGNRCTHSFITNIQYGVNTQSNLYTSRIQVETWARQTLATETTPTEPHYTFIED